MGAVVPAPSAIMPSDPRAEAEDQCNASQLVITKSTARWLWLFMLFMQLLCVSQLTAFGVGYLWYPNPRAGTLTRFLVRMFLTDDEVSYLDANAAWIGLSFVVLGLLYAATAGRMIWQSIRLRHLWFGPAHSNHGAMAETKTEILHSRANNTKQSHNSSVVAVPKRPHALVERLCGGIRWVYRAWWAYGVRGKEFDQGLLFRCAAGVFMQTLVAYDASLKISNVYITQSYMALLLARAVVNPIWFHVFAHNIPMKRFACVAGEFVIGFLWSTAIPSATIAQYDSLDRSLTLDELLGELGGSELYGFYEKAQRETRHVILLSVRAYLLYMLPLVATFISLRSLNNLLAMSKRANATNTVVAIASTTQATYDENGSEKVVPTKTKERRCNNASRATKQSTVRDHNLTVCSDAPASPLLVKWGLTAIMVYGISIFAVAMEAMTNKGQVADTDCYYRLAPWFSSQAACIGWNADCAILGMQGRREQWDNILAGIHVDAIGILRILNCHALEIPTAMAASDNLVTISIIDSVLLNWSDDVALVRDNFPHLLTLAFTNTTLVETPALMVPTWPPTLIRFIALTTDIHELAHSMDRQWAGVTSWYCVACGLRSVPPALFHARRLVWMSIMYTGIQDMSSPPLLPNGMGTMAEAELVWPDAIALFLDGNPFLSELSDYVWQLAAGGTLQFLAVKFTNVSVVPAPCIAQLPTILAVNAYGSPLCRNASLQADMPALNCSEHTWPAG